MGLFPTWVSESLPLCRAESKLVLRSVQERDGEGGRGGETGGPTARPLGQGGGGRGAGGRQEEEQEGEEQETLHEGSL